VNIAIIGSGISGLTAAHLIKKKHPNHRFTLFEARSRVGGHTHTVKVNESTQNLWVDTGFIIYNHLTYPLLFGKMW